MTLLRLDSSLSKEVLVKDAEQNLPLIQAENLGIKYANGKKRDDFRSIAHDFLMRRRKKNTSKFWALKNISFSGYPGEVLGIIGSNGAGKTTLCRVLSGLLRPDEGDINVRGKVSSLLSLGTGFNMELSGRENIFLNGMMLGLTRKQISELLPYIQDFSGLGSFLDQPLKKYSNGMKTRLGFSIAAAIEAEILVIDEVLGAGDMEFQERAVKRMWEMVKGAKMVVVVSHSLTFIENNCTSALWIERGELKASGEPGEVISLYKEKVSASIIPKKKKMISLSRTREKIGTKKAIEVDNLGIKFKLGRDHFWALQNVSFNVFEKEILGIIGHNGAGKTTLCRTLCGIYKGDKGRVLINGSVAALLSFGTGFNGQLSGRDNIYLNGMMLGFSKTFIESIEREIISFSELEKFIDIPVKNYSSGMKSRLGFSIAAMLKPDILIVDEALSAGDLSFQEKATIKMQEMLGDAKAVLIVTHSLKIVEMVCTRAIWLNKGNLVFDGKPKEVVKLYQNSIR